MKEIKTSRRRLRFPPSSLKPARDLTLPPFLLISPPSLVLFFDCATPPISSLIRNYHQRQLKTELTRPPNFPDKSCSHRTSSSIIHRRPAFALSGQPDEDFVLPTVLLKRRKSSKAVPSLFMIEPPPPLAPIDSAPLA